jgi:NAD+ synthase (glutamine-hydrolysing)
MSEADNHGFVRVAAAVPEVRVADCRWNAQKIIDIVKAADEEQAQFIVFPELSITAYTCADLFHQQNLISEAEKQLEHILGKTGNTQIVIMVGIPLYHSNRLFSCCAVIQGGRILGLVPKSNIAGYKELYEERWFYPGELGDNHSVKVCGQKAPFGVDLLFEDEDDSRICFGVEMCEDLWVPIPPSSYQALEGAVLFFNLSASNDLIGKYEYRKSLVVQQSAKCISGYVYTSCGTGESTTDAVYGGHALVAENGRLLKESSRFSREGHYIFTDIDIHRLHNDRMKNTTFFQKANRIDYRRIGFNIKNIKLETLSRHVTPNPFVPADVNRRDDTCREAFMIQSTGLAKRLDYTGLKRVLVGVSGGLDSTLALLVAVRTFDMMGILREGITAVTMPGFGTTGKTYNNAVRLMKALGVTVKEIDIKEACIKHFDDIGHDPKVYDIIYENVQARERTQVLMDLSNKEGGLVIGTGDLSEMALGWSTYNGDHMSMYAVNCSIPKTMVRYLVEWIADNVSDDATRKVLHDIIDTPITPELLPPGKEGEIQQKTEDIIGPYELHDFFLYHMVRYGAPPEKILFLAKNAFNGKYMDKELLKWLQIFYKRFFSQQYKRSCVPDGPKVGTISLSPRGDWRMPSDASPETWLLHLPLK